MNFSQVEAGGIARGKYRLFHTPFDPERRVVPANDHLTLRTIIFVAFVEKVRRFRKHNKTMRKAPRHP
jgi:hypothetical protein